MKHFFIVYLINVSSEPVEHFKIEYGLLNLKNCNCNTAVPNSGYW